ncbi:hypothetical protein ACO0LM_02400 [Undibacterium sp. Di26W]|uniref:hypothetical protein n=1 Tax=Undibacterium sp. Di26W TaxID=3413035 RepID=UPI003BF42DBB
MGILFIICLSKVTFILRHLWGTKFQGKLNTQITGFIFLLTITCHALPQNQQIYVGKWVPTLSQCRVIDFNLLNSGGDPYLIAECDLASPKEKSIRIWRAQYGPKRSKMLDVKITGEIILAWRPVDGSLSREHNKNEYWLLKCQEKSQRSQSISIDQFSAAGYIQMGVTKATEKNALIYFKQGQTGAIETVPFSKIANCNIPESE